MMFSCSITLTSRPLSNFLTQKRLGCNAANVSSSKGSGSLKICAASNSPHKGAVESPREPNAPKIKRLG